MGGLLDGRLRTDDGDDGDSWGREKRPEAKSKEPKPKAQADQSQKVDLAHPEASP